MPKQWRETNIEYHSHHPLLHQHRQHAHQQPRTRYGQEQHNRPLSRNHLPLVDVVEPGLSTAQRRLNQISPPLPVGDNGTLLRISATHECAVFLFSLLYARFLFCFSVIKTVCLFIVSPCFDWLCFGFLFCPFFLLFYALCTITLIS
uniref:Uncharacterized protein n=1 Tax=Anopheles culicifacies TaxID=139723 RepID=A0A182MFM3_9DIPT